MSKICNFTEQEICDIIEKRIVRAIVLKALEEVFVCENIIIKGSWEEQPRDEKGRWTEDVVTAYNNAVDENVIEFIDEVRSDNKKYIQPIEIAKINATQAQAMQILNGVDYAGYTVCLTRDTVAHIDKRHGKNGIADNSMADDRDLARIGWVVENFDEIELSRKKSRQYKNSDGSLADIFIFSKRINGHYYVAAAAPDTSQKQIYVTTAYKSKT